MKRALCFGMLCLGFSACVTKNGTSFEETQILERIGGKKETPEWAHGDKTTLIEGNEYVFISQVSVAGNSRTEACMKAADLEAQAGILKYIKTSITSSGQLNETDMASNPGFESLTTFFAAGRLNGVKTLEKYWEKRVESSESGERVLKLRCLSKVGIRKSDLEQQLRDAMGGTKGNAAAREALERATKKAIDSFGDEASAAK